MNRYTTDRCGEREIDNDTGEFYLVSEVEAVLRKIMAAASGVSEFHTKEFHRECLNQVRTIAHLALENRTL